VREERVPGSRGWPLSDKDRDDKFLDCAAAALEETAAGNLLAALKAMRSLDDVGRLARATAPVKAGAQQAAPMPA
jgi:hypothetical protein